jgi:GT2 family glycosyltransferase
MYVREYPPSLARQRNAGMARVAVDIDVAGYLDDDLILETNATERMIAFWRQAGHDVGGCAFNILNQPPAQAGPLTNFFLLNGSPPGRMLPSGWPAQIPTIEKTVETQWLYGGATLWRREVIGAFDYDEWFTGHGYGEDVDFSYRVGRKYRLFVIADAKVNHFTQPIRPASQYNLGRQQVVNRIYFIRKSGAFSAPAVCWAMFGQLVHNLLIGLASLTNGGLHRLAGNVAGMLALFRGGPSQIENFYK